MNEQAVQNGEQTNFNSAMPTPMHYFSRNSSMTSLNSFDIKSVHSSVASEYSQATSPTQFNSKSAAKIHALNGNSNDHEQDASDYLDDIDLIMPESPSAQHESSFLMAQRMIHKQQQVSFSN